MKRDCLDMALVRPEHHAIHTRMENWGKWCVGSRGMQGAHPMFRDYRDGYYEAATVGIGYDELDAVAVQRLFVGLPDKHRWVIQWCYCKPFIPVMRVRRALGLSTPDLYSMIHEARSMMKNRARANGQQ